MSIQEEGAKYLYLRHKCEDISEFWLELGNFIIWNALFSIFDKQKSGLSPSKS